jgi:hypothetical protein
MPFLSIVCKYHFSTNIIFFNKFNKIRPYNKRSTSICNKKKKVQKKRVLVLVIYISDKYNPRPKLYPNSLY